MTDKTKATSAWNKSVKEKEARREEFRAAKANVASKGNETESCSEEDDSDEVGAPHRWRWRCVRLATG